MIRNELVRWSRTVCCPPAKQPSFFNALIDKRVMMMMMVMKMMGDNKTEAES